MGEPGRVTSQSRAAEFLSGAGMGRPGVMCARRPAEHLQRPGEELDPQVRRAQLRAT